VLTTSAYDIPDSNIPIVLLDSSKLKCRLSILEMVNLVPSAKLKKKDLGTKLNLCLYKSLQLRVSSVQSDKPETNQECYLIFCFIETSFLA
jgi:hypothetical protein